jgi:hypothetical protein
MHACRAVFVSLLGLGLTPACGLDGDLPSLAVEEAEIDGSCKLAQQLARARAATAKYHNVAVAEAEGFVSTERCVFDPVLGTMGIHFVHGPRLEDQAIRLAEPEALLYLPQHGKLRLVAIEYVQVILIDGDPYMGCGIENNSCPPANPPPPPTLYEGVVFDGPMAGHEPGMPWHYDLHVWLWARNPAGMFTPFNPALSCEQGATRALQELPDQ